MRVIVGLSGGVDSAVAALLLKEQGHDVVGVFMKNWDEEDDAGACSAENDWKDVKSICRVLDIPHYSVNFTKEYYERVFQIFLDEYKAGRTPNPDVLCNREIKFKAFLNFALQMGADKIATGHFVNTNECGELLKGNDSSKDQSYFLYMLKEEQLKKAVFPVGKLSKAEVRSIAANKHLPVFDKKDSTGICFIGERNFKKFLSSYIPAQPGFILTDKGEAVGKHDGLMYYTIGQRRGLGIGGHGDGRSFFVIGKDLKKNILIVAQGEDSPLLFSSSANVKNITWINNPPEKDDLEIWVKCRYRQKDQAVKILLNSSKTEAKLIFKEKQRAITPGQSAVFYENNKCLGGGIIVSQEG